MKNPSQEDLLGFVLGALDAQEHADVQHYIDQHPEIEDELLQIKNSLLPLECISEPSGPPIGLARRTCEFVSVLDKHQAESQEITPASKTNLSRAVSPSTVPAEASSEPVRGEVSISQLVAASDQREQAKSLRSWSHADLLAFVAVIAILCGIMIPVVNYSRNSARVVDCSNNMRVLGNALMEYAVMNPDGNFVEIPSDPKLGVAGSYAPILKMAGLIEDDSVVLCAGVASDRVFKIPTFEQVNNASDEQLRFYQQTMGGDYGYSLGYAVNNRYQPWKNQGRTHVVLLTDTPSPSSDGRKSLNHGGRGQNALFEDGHVEFIRGNTIGQDSIFENDYGVVGTGIHERDNVIAPSHIAPLIFRMERAY